MTGGSLVVSKWGAVARCPACDKSVYPVEQVGAQQLRVRIVAIPSIAPLYPVLSSLQAAALQPVQSTLRPVN